MLCSVNPLFSFHVIKVVLFHMIDLILFVSPPFSPPPPLPIIWLWWDELVQHVAWLELFNPIDILGI